MYNRHSWVKVEGEEQGDHLGSLGLSVDRLEDDLQAAVRREQRHWNENDAKLRAVYQKVATYDEFKGIVDGCELRPLNFKEVEGAINKRYAGWAPAVSLNSMASNIANIKEPKQSFIDTPPEVFSNPDRFLKAWRDLVGRSNPGWEQACACLLLAQQPEFLRDVFSSGRALPILAQTLDCLLLLICRPPTNEPNSESSRQARGIRDVLWAISTAVGFDTSVLFLTDGERSAVRRIVDWLEQAKYCSEKNNCSLEQLRKNWCLL